MSEAIAVSVKGICKTYLSFATRKRQLMCYFFPKLITNASAENASLAGISFDIWKGESVAIIGRNGGGKSTLLQIITGTLAPTQGQAKVYGRVSALLELGSGFNPEFTGRENVLLNGMILGLSRDDMLRRFEEIEHFADIGSYIDRPVKSYSSGMVMRLAFAVQVLCEPDILIIDEALGVGDFLFQQKCLGYIKKLRERGVTLLFVSHDMGMVRDLCSRVLYLKEGRLIYDGPTKDGIYLFYKDGVSASNPKFMAPSSGIDYAAANEWSKYAIWNPQHKDKKYYLQSVSLLDSKGFPAETFRLGSKLIVRVCYQVWEGLEPDISVVVTDKFGGVVTATGTMHVPLAWQFDPESTFRVVDIEIQLLLESGAYGVSVNLGIKTGCNRGEVLNETGVLGPISVTWDYDSEVAPFLGRVGLPVLIDKRFESDL